MGVEEERGIVEFNLGAQSPEASVLLMFDTGNSAYSITDFDALATFFLGSFSTAGMIVGQQFSFDVTAAFNANAGGSLGIRLQPVSEPGQTSYTFDDFKLDTDPPAVPEPATLLMLGTGISGAAVRYSLRRRNRMPEAARRVTFGSVPAGGRWSNSLTQWPLPTPPRRRMASPSSGLSIEASRSGPRPPYPSRVGRGAAAGKSMDSLPFDKPRFEESRNLRAVLRVSVKTQELQ
jgi:hypothetical protein